MRTLALFPLAFVACTAAAAAQSKPDENVKVALETTKGKIVLELFPAKAPLTTKNFLAYVDAKFYNGTVFHRVIPGFMIQGGGFTKDLMEKPTRGPIKNEAGLANKRGTVAMARTNDPHSATSQFFVNVADNGFLDKGPGRDGYTVFGAIVEGMGAVDAIVASERLCPSSSKDPCKANLPPGMQDVPKDPILIIKAYRVK